MDAVGNGLAQICAERRREPHLLGRRQAQHPGRGRLRLCRNRDRRLRDRAAKHVQQGTERRGDLFRRGGRRGARLLEVLNVPPLVALRPLAGAAARALRVAERQPHLEREIGAQEIWEVGAVGANDEPHLVFAQTQMVEQDIARPVAQHFMQRRPRRRRIERRVEQLLDPCRVQIFRLAVPGIAQGPEAPIGRARSRRLDSAYGDLVGDRGAIRRPAVARELGMPRPRGRRRDLGEPEIRRPAVPLTRFGRDAAVGRDQRKLAVERLLSGDDDAQGRALPGRHRRGQDRDLGCLLAGAGWTLSL